MALVCLIVAIAACDTQEDGRGAGGGYVDSPVHSGGDVSSGEWGDTSSGDWMDPDPGPGPDTTPVVLAPAPPPAVSGGTMLVTSDGSTVVAADPDRDSVAWALLTPNSVAAQSLKLQPGDEPGRLAEDAAGLIHVALRRGGAVATIDLVNGTVVRRTAVCPAPRGVAYDENLDAIIVACVGGELVTLGASDGTVLRSLSLDDDLRDVIPLGGGLLAVTRLRSAEVLLLDDQGVIRSRSTPPSVQDSAPEVAWRTIAMPAAPGVIAMVHQRASTATIQLGSPGDWSGGNTPDIVNGAVTTFRFDLNAPEAPPVTDSAQVDGALPVDLAISADGSDFTVAFYGGQRITRYATTEISSHAALSGDVAMFAAPSVAYLDGARRVALLREPASFVIDPGVGEQVSVDIVGAGSVSDTGHDLFHLASRFDGSLACASCHPEGRDDGRVWQFDPIGPRRTPSLVGGILATAPFHWDGDLPDLQSLMDEVFTRRMGGHSEDGAHVGALERFVDSIPRVPIAPPVASASLDHGNALFHSMDIGCTVCHTGDHLTSNASVDVGTGKAFQVPSLIGVGLRAPYLHTGCAATLQDRFGPCGGGDNHGHTSLLSKTDVDDLVLYLQSL